jgi:hypothetical protein
MADLSRDAVAAKLRAHCGVPRAHRVEENSELAARFEKLLAAMVV